MSDRKRNKNKYIYLILPGLLVGLGGCGFLDGSDPGAQVNRKPLERYELPALSQVAAEHTADEADRTGEQETAKENITPSNQSQAAIEVQEDSLYDKVTAILQLGDRKFFAGYPVDDSFLLWFHEKYGEQAFEQLARITEITLDEDVWYEASGSTMHVLWLEYCKDMGLHSADLDRVTWQDCESEDQIVMSFTGDMNFDDRIGTMQRMKKDGIAGVIDSGVRAVMAESDILMINNECAYTTNTEPLEGKTFTFRSDPSNVKLLKDLGVDIAGIANNHVCDYGLQGVSDTVDALKQAGMPYVGAGHNIEEAKSPWYFIANGRKIAIVAATQIERTYNYTKEATEDTPGVLKTLQPDKFIQAIKDAEKQCDFVIAFVHWGTEGSHYYEEDQKDLSEYFAEAGADAIIGGHTHCLQGMRYIEDVPVIYSLGNFWFGSTATDGVRKRDSGIAQVIIDRDNEITFRFIPCIQENQRTYLAEDYEKERIIDFMQGLSDGVWIDEDGYVSAN